MTDFAAVLVEANRAAQAAQNALLARHGGEEPQLACGFAWVDIQDPKHPFVKWCKAQLKAAGLKYDSAGNLCNLDGTLAKTRNRDFGTPHWKRGWQFWAPGDFLGQWVDCKEAGAQAFANVLTANDIPATFGSRLD